MQAVPGKETQLIKFRREGKSILYSLADDHVATILKMGLEHVLSDKKSQPKGWDFC